ncbi:MAG: hypothetical protein O9302_01035 [Cyclobacteriaceae bacterium]|jgi:hypothetical protein|nr:hypothetical protein [Flammeovirgaceae bacterium]MCZ8022309.1 hypothetical protein [Cytophagales bacterium]MCZ8326614.1 hypothetical protein [Cyclobacteriaceae bacterium]
MNLTKIVSFILLIISLSLAYYLYNSIDSTIEERKAIAATEAIIIDKLSIIREAEKVYLEQHGKYTSSWDTLTSFIENGIVPIIVKRDSIVSLGYGQEKAYQLVDTIGKITAKEKIFNKIYNITAAENGVITEILVKPGESVVKGSKSYRMKKDGSTKVDEFTFLEPGTVNQVARIEPGTRVSKGQLLVSFTKVQFNDKIDIKTLGQLPDSDKTFDIFTNVIERNGIKVSVIEVKDPAPINPDRKESNEAKNRKPLRFGSRTDVSTAGNWE